MSRLQNELRATAKLPPIPESAGNGQHVADDESAPLDRKAPLDIANRFIAANYSHAEIATLVFSDDEFHTYNGAHWEVLERPAVREQLYKWLDRQPVIGKCGIGAFKPTVRDIDYVLDAMKAAAYQPAKPPAWIGTFHGAGKMDPAQLIIARNGIFTIGESLNKVASPTPRMFSLNSLDYELKESAPKPLRWFEFLDDIFQADSDQIEALQEWCGLVLTSDTRYQKMLLLVGPPRSGKGTLARVLTRVVGAANVCAPTLAGLGTNFGLWPLVGKTLAIVSDARLSGRTDHAIVTERLLSISGEDSLTVDRKNRELVTVKLSTRIMLLSNELPRLADASGALANRFIILSLKKSYLGNENVYLSDQLAEEVQGIATWALEGLRRLRVQNGFTEPTSANELRQELNDLASPTAAFLRECCRVQNGAEVKCGELFEAWCAWGQQQGMRNPGTQQTFGRDLRAVMACIGSRQSRDGEQRVRVYTGIALTAEAACLAEKWRLARDGTRANPSHATREGASYV